jgi:ATP-dependent protease ClpP protease subunit
MGKKRKKRKFQTLVHKEDIQITNQPQRIELMAEELKQKRLLLEKREKRKRLIEQLEDERGSKIISYITAERQNFGAGMSSDDTIPLFYEHLQSIKKVEKIDLFLYTRGGHTLAPNRIVHLLREFCEKLSVLIPFRAYSAGTTLALGSDEIVMGSMGELGPVDPSVTNDFNPLIDDKDPKKGHIPISVEDVSAYMTLIKEKGLSDPSVFSVGLKALTDRIHPLALGNVHRQYLLIRTLSKRLLELHMKGEKEKEKIEKIVETLTEKLYYHGYQISRHEAKEIIGLNVIYPPEKAENLMSELYIEYKDALLPGEELDFNRLLGNLESGDLLLDSAIIESRNLIHSFTYSLNAKRKKGTNEFDVNVKKMGWEKLETQGAEK